MKKVLLFFVLFFCSFSVKAHSLNVLGLGDSITTGYGVSRGYFDLTCEKIQKEQKATCTNLAVDGFTTDELLKKLEDREYKENIRKADIIMISIGGNDFLKELISHMNGTTLQLKEINLFAVLEKVENNIGQIYKIIEKENSKVFIYWIPLYNPYYQLVEKVPSLEKQFEQIKEEYKNQLLTKKNVYLSETISQNIENKKYLNATLTYFDPHPSAEGHKWISETLYIEKVKGFLPSPKNKFPILIVIGILSLLIILYFIFYWYHRKELV